MHAETFSKWAVREGRLVQTFSLLSSVLLLAQVASFTKGKGMKSNSAWLSMGTTVRPCSAKLQDVSSQAATWSVFFASFGQS